MEGVRGDGRVSEASRPALAPTFSFSHFLSFGSVALVQVCR